MVNGHFSQRFVKNDYPLKEATIENDDDLITSSTDLVKTILSYEASENVNKETNSNESCMVDKDLEEIEDKDKIN